MFSSLRNIFSSFFPATSLDGPNYRFIAWTDPKPVPKMNLRNIESNYKVVKYALEHELFGWDSDYIINNFYMPQDSESLVYETMQKGNLPPHDVPKDEHYLRARAQALHLISPPYKVRPVAFPDLRYYPWNWTPSAEEPYTSAAIYKDILRSKYDAGEIINQRYSFGNLADEIFVRSRIEVHNIKRNISRDGNLPYQYRMNIHAKPQLSEIGGPSKVRMIYGVPKLSILIECMFFWPIIKYHKYAPRMDTHMLWPYVTILGGWHRLNHDLLIRHCYYNTFFTVDWSGFDFHAIFSVIKDLQDDWKTMFVFDQGYIPMKSDHYDYSSTTTDPSRITNLWNWMCAAQLALPFRMPDGSVWLRLHRGIPSGLFTTQWLDSHYNLVMLFTILDRMGLDITSIFIKVQGDDSIAAIRVFIPADQHADFKVQFSYYAKIYFDATARPEKTDIRSTPQGLEVLGYANNNGLPTRDWRKLLAQLLYPKSRNPTYETLMARSIGITYADCDAHHEVRRVCSNVHHYLKSKGYSPSRAGLRDLPLFSDDPEEIQLDHFPSRLEVTRYLRSFHQFTEENKLRFWPSVFLSDH
jgi:hypothetical protein